MTLPTVVAQGSDGSFVYDRQTRSRNWIKFQVPLVAPATQSLIPVISEQGQVFGFLPVSPAVTFPQGTTLFSQNIEGTPYFVQSVTLPTIGSSGQPEGADVRDLNTLNLQARGDYGIRGDSAAELSKIGTGNAEDQIRVQQYMALVLSDQEVRLSVTENAANAARLAADLGIPLMGDVLQQFSTLIRAENPRRLGYTSFWSQPVMYIMHWFDRGIFLDAMRTGYDVTPVTPTPPVPPNPNPGALTWAADLNPNINEECAFIDFNWIALFNEGIGAIADPGMAQGAVIPLSITVTGNPPTGEFKAMVLQSSNSVTYPGGATSFDTVRILRLHDVQSSTSPQTFTFNFSIGYAYNTAAGGPMQTVPATLTLTVPARPAS